MRDLFRFGLVVLVLLAPGFLVVACLGAVVAIVLGVAGVIGAAWTTWKWGHLNPRPPYGRARVLLCLLTGSVMVVGVGSYDGSKPRTDDQMMASNGESKPVPDMSTSSAPRQVQSVQSSGTDEPSSVPASPVSEVQGLEYADHCDDAAGWPAWSHEFVTMHRGLLRVSAWQGNHADIRIDVSPAWQAQPRSYREQVVSEAARVFGGHLFANHGMKGSNNTPNPWDVVLILFKLNDRTVAKKTLTGISIYE